MRNSSTLPAQVKFQINILGSSLVDSMDIEPNALKDGLWTFKQIRLPVIFYIFATCDHNKFLTFRRKEMH